MDWWRRILRWIRRCFFLCFGGGERVVVRLLVGNVPRSLMAGSVLLTLIAVEWIRWLSDEW